jgi:hypothetical protein
VRKRLLIRSKRDDARRLLLVLGVLPSATRRFSQIFFTHDVVSLKDASVFMTCYHHRYPLGYARANHVPHGDPTFLVSITA